MWWSHKWLAVSSSLVPRVRTQQYHFTGPVPFEIEEAKEVDGTSKRLWGNTSRLNASFPSMLRPSSCFLMSQRAEISRVAFFASLFLMGVDNVLKCLLDHRTNVARWVIDGSYRWRRPDCGVSRLRWDLIPKWLVNWSFHFVMHDDFAGHPNLRQQIAHQYSEYV